jgi:hypothetical protein
VAARGSTAIFAMGSDHASIPAPSEHRPDFKHYHPSSSGQNLFSAKHDRGLHRCAFSRLPILVVVVALPRSSGTPCKCHSPASAA